MAMMTLGNFFEATAGAHPVNPRPVTFTALCKGTVLPGGQPNKSGRPVAARVTACFVFIGGGGASAARIEARDYLRSKFVDKESKLPLAFDEIDLNLETVYREMHIALHEWDPEEKIVGKQLFIDLDVMRQMIEPDELTRINKLYTQYLKDEHPSEALDAKTFREGEGGGKESPRKPSR